MSELYYYRFALMGLFTLLISVVQGDIRCHCNQPACVRTGYMCKSKGPQAGCFVEHSGYVTVDRSSDISRHGCIEMLPTEERVSCLDLALASTGNLGSGLLRSSHHLYLSSHHGRRPTNVRTHNKSITCCFDDMCNYVKTIVEEDSYSVGNEEHQSRHHHRRPVVVSNSHNFESLGRHLQELHGINDPLQSESLWLIPVCIIVLIIFLVMLIFFVIRYIRQDEEQNLYKKQKYSQKITTVSQMQMSNKLLPSHDKRLGSIMPDWRNLMSRRANTSQQRHMTYGQSERCSIKSKQASLLLSVKVDLNSSLDPSVTKVVEEEATMGARTNLPNIISVHTLPANCSNSSEEDTFHSKETTFLSGSRENHNSIYMSLLSPSVDLLNTANFDLISSANPKSMV